PHPPPRAKSLSPPHAQSCYANEKFDLWAGAENHAVVLTLRASTLRKNMLSLYTYQSFCWQTARGGVWRAKPSKKSFFVASFCQLRWQKEATKRCFRGPQALATPAGE